MGSTGVELAPECLDPLAVPDQAAPGPGQSRVAWTVSSFSTRTARLRSVSSTLMTMRTSDPGAYLSALVRLSWTTREARCATGAATRSRSPSKRRLTLSPLRAARVTTSSTSDWTPPPARQSRLATTPDNGCMGLLPSRDKAGDEVLAGGSSTGEPQALVIRGLLALVGLGLVGVGVAAVFSTDGGAGSATLVGVGSLLVLFGALGDQLESLRFGDLEVRLLRKRDEAARRGDREEAEALQRAADIVGKRARKTAAAYKSVRNGMPAGPNRTAIMDDLVERASADAQAHDLDGEQVLQLLWSGSEGARVWALAVLQKRPEFATPRAVLDAIQHPDQMFDQYQALILADNFVKSGTSAIWTLERVGEAVHDQLHSGNLGTDEPAIHYARLVLADASRRIHEEAHKQNKQVELPAWSDCPKCVPDERARG